MDDAPVPWCGQYVLGGEDGHEPVPCYNLLEWGRIFESDVRVVAWSGNSSKYVSTVFLGLDHSFWDGPPLVFESMLFIDGHGDEMDRYSTWAEAEAGHKRFVQKYLIDAETRTRVKVEED